VGCPRRPLTFELAIFTIVGLTQRQGTKKPCALVALFFFFRLEVFHIRIPIQTLAGLYACGGKESFFS
jgi:hypothetical protein